MSPVHDASAQKLDVQATGITGATRNGDPDAKISSTGSLSVPESPMFDMTDSLTLEAWVNPSTWPTSTWSVVANEGQYKMVIDPYGHPGCEMAGTQVYTSGYYNLVPPGTWHHIACTYAGDGTVRVYLDGNSTDCNRGSGTLSTNGTTGTSVASNFKGEFDAVRIYAKDMTADICKHAGHTQCQQLCQAPETGGPGPIGGH